MVGMERSIFQNLLKLNLEWLQNSYSIIYSSIQVTKAITNYFTGKLANRFGRKIYFYLVGFSHSSTFYFNICQFLELGNFNILLGISQGNLELNRSNENRFSWRKDRGFAMGLNEFAGYFAVGLSRF
jgi:MFS family permease